MFKSILLERYTMSNSCLYSIPNFHFMFSTILINSKNATVGVRLSPKNEFADVQDRDISENNISQKWLCISSTF